MTNDATRLDGKVAIVTGAAQGIGAGIARRVAAAGASVIVADVKENEGEESAEGIRENGGNAEFIQADVSEESGVVQLIEHAVDVHGKLDITSRHAVPQMRKQGGVFCQCWVNIKFRCTTECAGVYNVERCGASAYKKLCGGLCTRQHSLQLHLSRYQRYPAPSTAYERSGSGETTHARAGRQNCNSR